MKPTTDSRSSVGGGPFCISIEDIHLAAERLSSVAVCTPLLENAFLNELAGKRVLIKAEVLQRTGSFKFRGAWNALSALDDGCRARGVIAYSSGNHAQGLAHAAALQGVDAVIVMPNDAPALKVANTRGYGAEVITYDRPGGESREQLGEAIARERGMHLIRPYDDPDVIAGQGSCGLEIAWQVRQAGVSSADMLVCCGGGGLSSGISIALASEHSGLRVRTVEPAVSNDTQRSLIAGQRLANEGIPLTLCDAINTPMPGELTFPILQSLAGPGLTVTDEQVLDAMKQALLRLKLIVEPGGAVALAAALYDQSLVGDAIVCIVSGGNVDLDVLRQALTSE